MRLSIKGRLFGVLCLAISSALFAYNWRQAIQDQGFSLRLCAATPMFMLMSLLIIIAPRMLGRFNTQDKTGKVIILVVLITGGLLGGLNFYAMDTSSQKNESKPLDRTPPMPDTFTPRSTHPPDAATANRKPANSKTK